MDTRDQQAHNLTLQLPWLQAHGQTLEADVLYLGDNGRCFCGTLACAGVTAYATGRDVSGQKVLPLTLAVLASYPDAQHLSCEGCGRPVNGEATR